MSKAIASFILFTAALTYSPTVRAAYVLPYPSYMPGHKLYRVMRLFDQVKRYWYWGDLASYRYSLGQSDKALVEAKTLFEYGQYLLAMEALERSNALLPRAPDALKKAKQEGKETEKYELEFGEAISEHKKVIVKLLEELPEEFTWHPERENPKQLYIHEELTTALRLRQ